MKKMHWIHTSNAAFICLVSALVGFASFAASEENTIIDTRNDAYQNDHPDQYQSWKQTEDSVEIEDALAEDPNMVILWAGYGFAKDYNKARGHFYALDDVRQTLRTGAPKDGESGPMPMACWSCKSPDVARVIDERGEDGYFEGKWSRLGDHISNPIGCADCTIREVRSSKMANLN